MVVAMSDTHPLTAAYRFLSHRLDKLGAAQFTISLPWAMYAIIEGELIHRSMSDDENEHVHQSATFARGDDGE